MFRRVEVPFAIQGKLYLHSMPGRYEDLGLSQAEILDLQINQIVSLAALDEIHLKSPRYSAWIRGEHPDWKFNCLPIPDYSIPQDGQNFIEFARRIGSHLANGDNIMVHCGAGIGRTGLFASALLTLFGLSLQQSLDSIRKSGSHPETEEQMEFLKWFVENTKGGN